MLLPESKIKKLKAQFPGMWLKAGAEFSGQHDGTIWSGEGSMIDGESAFNYYGYGNTRGVHPRLERALSKLGLYAEFHDAGTVFFYVR